MYFVVATMFMVNERLSHTGRSSRSGA